MPNSAAMSAKTIDPVNTSAIAPKVLPEASEAPARPLATLIANTTSSNPARTAAAIQFVPSSSPPPDHRGSGGGSGSPSMTPIMRSTPASMPAPNSPARKAGRTVSSMTRRDTRSVNAPSSPRPASTRMRRSCLAMMRIAPSSTPLRPGFQASATRIEYCSISSGCVVSTMSTATCEPLRSSKACSFCSSRAFSSGCSRPMVSTTRAE